MIIAATRDPAGFVLKHQRRDAWELLPNLGSALLDLIFLSFRSALIRPLFGAPVIYIFDRDQLVGP